jgi:hypothetical protein
MCGKATPFRQIPFIRWRLRLQRFEAEPLRELFGLFGKPEAFRTSDGIAEEISGSKLSADLGSEWLGVATLKVSHNK